ncbi:50S ribosomal protein L13 [Candidatus Woesearchaeota archaeon CG10_big_fil_rev_8_21_14_0_10_36_11]|nr:MAG: 50S ribosomal protein L13 [Candidatus Woesearchaeota archaeon CG10_big_fil_rev_8_21_14_0_10_36_11]
MKIYDGKDLLLGRLASRVAKDALLGEEVKVVNCEKIMVSGKKVVVFTEEKVRRARKGYPLKSAKRTRLADRYVRRSIRGMLPWKQTRGKDAFKRIMCYTGIPDILADKELITLQDSSIKKLPTRNRVTVGEICKHVGGK